MLRALETFHVEHATIVVGELVEDDHPAVQGRERLFERVDEPARPARKPRR